MLTMWKYPLPEAERFTLDLPHDAQPLTVQCQHGAPCLWVKLDTDAPRFPRTFHLYGTGHPIEPDVSLWFIGTFQLQRGTYVFHLFEEVA